MIAALIGNSLIAVTKFIAAYVTGSSAMISEGIHSVVDTGNQFLLLYGLQRSKIPPSHNHPFGYGKEAFFWSLVVAILLFSLGAGFSIYEGIISWHSHRGLVNPTVNYVVLGAAFIFESGPWWIAFRSMFHDQDEDETMLEAIQDAKDPTLLAVFFEDSAAMIGITVAFFGIFLTQLTGNSVFDSMASLIIGVLLATVAVWLAYESKALLIGERADPELIADVRKMILRDTRVTGVMDLLTMHLGPEEILLNVYVDFVNTISGKDVETAISDLEKQIKGKYPQVLYLFIAAKDKSSK